MQPGNIYSLEVEDVEKFAVSAPKILNIPGKPGDRYVTGKPPFSFSRLHICPIFLLFENFEQHSKIFGLWNAFVSG